MAATGDLHPQVEPTRGASVRQDAITGSQDSSFLFIDIDSTDQQGNIHEKKDRSST